MYNKTFSKVIMRKPKNSVLIIGRLVLLIKNIHFCKRKLFLFVSFYYIFFNSFLVAECNSKHPALILTEEKLSELRKSINNSKKDLWKCFKLSADTFLAKEAPQIKINNQFRYIGERLPALTLTYLLTNDKKYFTGNLKWIKALLSIPSWGNEDDDNLLRAAWSIAIALNYDWLYDQLNDELKEKIENRLIKEGLKIKKSASRYRALSNHLLIETSALGIIGLSLFENKVAKSFRDQADKWAEYIIKYAPTDGAWGEGILYWQYGLRYFLLYLSSAETSGFKDYYKNYEWLKKTGYFPIYFSLPGDTPQYINFGDSPSRVRIPSFIFYIIASKYNNGYFHYFGMKLQEFNCAENYNWMDLIAYDNKIEPKNINELPTLHHFSDMGFVVMRNNWQKDATVIGFRCGPAPGHRNQENPLKFNYQGFGPGHEHPDINSFCIYSNGKWLAIDPGYTHLKETRNHNTIIINSSGQAGANKKWLDYLEFEKREPAPRILSVVSNDIYDYVIGDAGNIYVDAAGLKKFQRHILFLKPNILIIADQLETKKQSNFEWLIHAKNKIIQINSKQFITKNGNVSLNIESLLPEDAKSELVERNLVASELKIPKDSVYNTLKTLKIIASSKKRLLYLNVLYILPDTNVKPPEILFRSNELIVSTGKIKRRIKGFDMQTLKVDDCEPLKSDYYWGNSIKQ